MQNLAWIIFTKESSSEAVETLIESCDKFKVSYKKLYLEDLTIQDDGINCLGENLE